MFNAAEGEAEGSWRINLDSGERAFVASGFGLPSANGDLIAFPRRSQGRVSLTDSNGADLGQVPADARVAWPSPDGQTIAWLEHLPLRTPSSSVNRSVRLHVANHEIGTPRPVLDLQAAEVHWMPDNRHLIVPARDLQFEQAGVWKIDTEDGSYEILFQELFVQNVRLAPDGKRVAVMRTFNSDPEANGLWVLRIDTGELTRVNAGAPYRWGANAESLWLLEMTPTGGARDVLRLVDVSTGELSRRVELDGQVRNDAWEISPDGSLVAFWRHEDGQVVVQSLN